MSLLLGIDLGTSFIKVSVVDTANGACLATVQSAEESSIISKQPGWAEQDPETWWENVKKTILLSHSTRKYNPADISAIGIAYQMHGLVLVDNEQNVLRNSIIWCDSRAVSIGDEALKHIGEQRCLQRLLNSPGNFTASKLAWVKDYEPAIYDQIDKIMLPGDFISMKLTGAITTTPSALSEGILWDFSYDQLSEDVMTCFRFCKDFIPKINPVFSEHGYITDITAKELSLKPGIPVSYKAGDQLNNALSLNVLSPGEVAATAGTSGVIYAVTDQLFIDQQSRVNSFAHVNHHSRQRSLGVLLCINGCGIMNSWARKMVALGQSYDWMNEAASNIPIGSEGLTVLPFGNGAERMLRNKTTGAQLLDLDLNKHTPAHICRGVQEGIAFAFRYGLDIMRENGLQPKLVRAGKANMFLSNVFIDAFVNSTELEVELYQNDGSVGAAIGAGIGANIYKTAKDGFVNFKPINKVVPAAERHAQYEHKYQHWKEQLSKRLNN